MKKLLFPILAFHLLCFNSNGQLVIGPIAGINIATITGKNSEFAATQIGIHFGIGAEVPISENFLIDPSILYSMKGAKNHLIEGMDLHINYIEIPVNGKYRFDSGFNLFAGPYLGIVASAKYSTGTENLKSRITGTDFGLNIGLGIDSKTGFGVSAQYGFGLTNLNSDTRVSNSLGTIGISLRYMFGKS